MDSRLFPGLFRKILSPLVGFRDTFEKHEAGMQQARNVGNHQMLRDSVADPAHWQREPNLVVSSVWPSISARWWSC